MLKIWHLQMSSPADGQLELHLGTAYAQRDPDRAVWARGPSVWRTGSKAGKAAAKVSEFKATPLMGAEARVSGAKARG